MHVPSPFGHHPARGEPRAKTQVSFPDDHGVVVTRIHGIHSGSHSWRGRLSRGMNAPKSPAGLYNLEDSHFGRHGGTRNWNVLGQ